jgi:hypothetical protein
MSILTPASRALTGLLLVASFGLAQQTSVNINPGEWLIESRTVDPDDGSTLGEQEYRNCLNLDNLVPVDPEQSGGDPSFKCKRDAKSANNVVKWTFVCSDSEGLEIKGSGEITYSGDTLTGKAAAAVKAMAGGGVTHLNYELKGKRVGDCKGK